jgi:hypothetical protein
MAALLPYRTGKRKAKKNPNPRMRFLPTIMRLEAACAADPQRKARRNLSDSLHAL